MYNVHKKVGVHYTSERIMHGKNMVTITVSFVCDNT